MGQIAIFVQDNGIPAVVFPTPEALAVFSMQQIAVNSIPVGKPFKIMESSELPEEPQETWEVNEADLTDGIGEFLDYPGVQL